MTAVLRIDDKWSVEYDPENNDLPLRLLRYGEQSVTDVSRDWNNPVMAMYYALLEARRTK